MVKVYQPKVGSNKAFYATLEDGQFCYFSPASNKFVHTMTTIKVHTGSMGFQFVENNFTLVDTFSTQDKAESFIKLNLLLES